MAMQSQNLNAGGMTALMGGVGDVFNLVGAAGEYKRSQEQGDSGAISIAKAAGNFAWSEFYYGGVARMVSEGPIGPIFSKAGQGIGSAVGHLAGGVTGGVVGGAAKTFGAKASLLGKAGTIAKGASIAGKAGEVIGGMVGGMLPVMALTMAPQMAAQLPQFWSNTGRVIGKSYRQRGKLGSGYFEMTQSGYTMRQRSLNAIRQNGLNMQSALGNEARMYFRGSGIDD